MKVRALVGFQTTMLGSIAPGDVFECKPERAAQFIAEGRAEPYETKVIQPRPTETASSLSASQAAPASQQTIAKESKTGGKRKKTGE